MVLMVYDILFVFDPEWFYTCECVYMVMCSAYFLYVPLW